jgi:hypothetical protein
MQYTTLHYIALKCCTIWYSTSKYNTVQTMQDNIIQCSTKWSCRTQYSTVQYSTVQSNAVTQSDTIYTIHNNRTKHKTIQFKARQCRTVQCNTVQHNTMQCTTTRHNAESRISISSHLLSTPLLIFIAHDRYEEFSILPQRTVFPQP